MSTVEPTPEVHSEPDPIEIFIDNKPYRAPKRVMSGKQIRELAKPPITEDYDLWEEVPHGEDKLIGDNEEVHLKIGDRFKSVQKHINPGRLDLGVR